VQAITIQLDRALSSSMSDLEAADLAALSDLGPSSECRSDHSSPTEIEVEPQLRNGRLVIRPFVQLPPGHLFRLELDPGLTPRITANDQDFYHGPKTFFFATRAITGEPIAAMASEPTAARDILQIGNLMVVAGSSGHLFAVDTSTIISDEPGDTDPGTFDVHSVGNVSAELRPRTLATDGHNRVFFSYGSQDTWSVRSVRVEDIRSAAAECVDLPVWAGSAAGCFELMTGGV
jgi:hypothetical protein